MAIHPTGEAPQSTHNASTTQPINIEDWTEAATVALSSVNISTPGELSGPTVALEIPLDDKPVAPATSAAKEGAKASYARKELLRRDSMKSRERLLKGNEGSRRRQRWENGMCHPHPSCLQL